MRQTLLSVYIPVVALFLFWLMVGTYTAYWLTPNETPVEEPPQESSGAARISDLWGPLSVLGTIESLDLKAQTITVWPVDLYGIGKVPERVLVQVTASSTLTSIVSPNTEYPGETTNIRFEDLTPGELVQIRLEVDSESRYIIESLKEGV